MISSVAFKCLKFSPLDHKLGVLQNLGGGVSAGFASAGGGAAWPGPGKDVSFVSVMQEGCTGNGMPAVIRHGPLEASP